VDTYYDKVLEYRDGASFTSGTHYPDAKWNLAYGNSKPEGIGDPPEPTNDAATTERASDSTRHGLWTPSRPETRSAFASRMASNVDELAQRVVALANRDRFQYWGLSEERSQDPGRGSDRPDDRAVFDTVDNVPVELLDEAFRDVSDALLEGVFA
jgi:hypothetical protein